MTQEQQTLVSNLLKQKSELFNDLSRLIDPSFNFELCANRTLSYMYSLTLSCSKDKDLNDTCKGIVIEWLSNKISEIDKQLEKI